MKENKAGLEAQRVMKVEDTVLERMYDDLWTEFQKGGKGKGEGSEMGKWLTHLKNSAEAIVAGVDYRGGK